MVCCWQSFFAPEAAPRPKRLPDVGNAPLSSEQKADLVAFRRATGAWELPEFEALRFLRARKWDVAAAVQQYQDTVRWREENDVARFCAEGPGPAANELSEDQFSELCVDGVEAFPALRLINSREDEGAWLWYGLTAAFGFDREGRPMHLQKAGYASQRFAAMYTFAGNNAGHRLVYDGYVRMQELQAARMRESSQRLGRQVTQQVVIMDMKGLSFWPDPRAMSVFKEFLSVSQRYYPETLGVQFFLNTPPIFLAIWRLIKDWIDPVTASKMHLMGSDFQGALLQYIAPDQLPAEYGGTNSFQGLNTQRTLPEIQSYYAIFEGAAEALPGRRKSSASLSRASRSRIETPSPQSGQKKSFSWLVALLSILLVALIFPLLSYPAQP
mmetsp:Transcript_50667/g.120955  ORF Transcript_50667/g.120955 Transcript_50667/m.120955 type:complete len:384 (-) Transcript_50667:63-1214(-)